MRILFLIALLGAIELSAAPSRRILPERLIDSNEQVNVLRDHEKANRFYVVPKVFQVYQNGLRSYGEQTDGCLAVSQFSSTQQLLVETRQELARVSLQRTQIVSRLLQQILDLDERQRELDLERLDLQAQLDNNEVTGELSEEKIEKIRKRISEIDAFTGNITERLAHIEKLQKIAEDEHKKILDQISKLEESLDNFSDMVTKPAGKVQVKLRLPTEDLGNAEFRKSIGFNSSDEILFPKLVGVKLFPDGDQYLSFRERAARGEAIGVFKPDWSIRPLEVQETYFGDETLSPVLEQRDFPTRIFFEQIVSLYDYCALKDQSDATQEFISPLRIEYTIAGWKDVKEQVNESVILSHKKSLPAMQWERLAALPEQSSGVQESEGVDVGHPDRFNEGGFYEARSFNILFDFGSENNQ